MSDLRPIGVFDSGIGGLTVVKELRDLLPDEKIFYLGDTARVPYGGKSASTVERYSLEIAEMLIEENAKMVVVACNTASSVALPNLEKTLSVPVIGVIRPGAQAASRVTRNRHIGVIGTRATIKSGAYEKALREFDAGLRVSTLACPLLVPLIEEGWLEDELNYPLLTNAIARVLEHKVSLVDSARNCATAVQELLDRYSLCAPSGNNGSLKVALTDQPDNFLRVAREALDLDVGKIQLREILHGAVQV